jgi:glutamine amidotransferase/cyclase
VKGGRETTNLDVVQLVQAVVALGAGEILVNSIDRDGQQKGFDLSLLCLMRKYCSVPIVASSGAGSPQHFVDAFQEANVDAALAAGIFHKGSVHVKDVKRAVAEAGEGVRP